MDNAKRAPLVGLFALLVLILATKPAAAQADLQGMWNHGNLMQEDRAILINAVGGAARVGDYTGIPLNDAGRQMTDSWQGARLDVPEHQCHPHPTQYSLWGPGNWRITNILDPQTDRVLGFTLEGTFGRATRTIWLDGRPHPPEYVRHTWAGFSTGTWDGNRLTVTTTHLKEGWFQRNGLTTTDRTTMREHFIKNDNYLTVVIVLNDPDVFEEPFIRTTQAVLDPTTVLAPSECQPFNTDLARLDNREQGYVAHWLPGQNPHLREYSEQFGVPYEAARGGAKTTYPEYIAEIKKWIQAQKRPATSSSN